MTLLSLATLELSRKLFQTMEGIATGGNATTVVDTVRFEPDDWYDQGTIWMISGLNAGKSAQVTAWTLAGTTFTFPTMTLLNAAGNVYAAAPPDFPRWLLIQSINESNRFFYPSQDNTALVTVADQESYNLPAGVYNILSVEIATQTAAPLDYISHYNYKERNGTIRFDKGHVPQTAGFTIRLSYRPQPAQLSLDADVIDNQIDLDALTWKAAVHALRWRLSFTGRDEKAKVERYQEFLAEAERHAAQYPPPNVERDAHFATYGSDYQTWR
jgi:hypothetical protein